MLVQANQVRIANTLEPLAKALYLAEIVQLVVEFMSV